MFQKPAFGTTNTSTFGSFNAGSSTASPFGGFKSTTGTSAFGAPPAFGAAASTQPAAGSGLFGATNTTGGLFGNTAASTSTPAFGASTSTFGGFGASGSTSGGLFNTSSTGLFGQTQNTSAFGAKPAGFGFGSTPAPQPAAGGLFGAAPATGSSLFPQNTSLGGGGGLFNNTSAFGQQQTASGTGHVKYNPVVGTDVVVKSGTSQNINIKHHCITCMKEYENKSLEELRLEDYTAGRKGQQQAAGMFGGSFTQPEAKPLFGAPSFGQPAATTASSVFGAAPAGGGFMSGGGAFSFGAAPAPAQPAQPAGLFGAKPAFGATPAPGTGLFGATTTQAPSFGTNTSTFGFGNTTTQNQATGGIFGAKPATSTFGTPAGGAAFGGFGAGGLFPAKPAQAAPAFGQAQPAFGSLSTSFGTTTSSAGGLFANSSFGKPAQAQPTLGFNTQPTAAPGTGLGGLGATAFQAKPGAAPFGALGGGSLFSQPQQTNSFMSKPDGGLGGGMFGNTSFGQSTLGLGMNNPTMANNSLSGSSATGNVHEQILTLAARPYGDSPLFKHLLPEGSTPGEDVLKPTNPAAVKAVLDRSASAGYRLTSPGAALRLQPRPRLAGDKKSLFDGLEESDASLEDKLSLKPSRKRLVLRPNQKANDDSQHNDSQGNRSLEEEPPARQVNGQEQEKEAPDAPADDADRAKRAVNFGFNYDAPTEKNKYWMGPGGASSPKFPQEWSEKEKPIDGEPTPRLYPNIDKEINMQTSDRRASWLTTKPLRKPLASNPESAENSVRELGVRSPSNLSDKENRDSLSGPSAEPLQFCSHRGGVVACNCEKIAHQIQGVYVSEEENVLPRDMPPHPTGVKLTRPGYYTIPSLDEMIQYMRGDGSCVVPHLCIGRHNYGNVLYDCPIDVAGLDLDALVHFLNKEVIVYPSDADKPPVGRGLNRRAVVTLDRVWPRDKTQRHTITDPDRLLKMEYESKLRRVCDKHDTKFIEYRPQTGSWVFRVEHFSKYGLTDSDEEDDPTPEVLKRQLVKQAVQQAAPPGQRNDGVTIWRTTKDSGRHWPIIESNGGVWGRPLPSSGTVKAPKPVVMPSPGLGGLGGLGLPPSLGLLPGLGLSPGLSAGLGGLSASEDTLLAMHQTSLNLLNGAGKAFEMDTTEDNTESQSMYQDHRRAFGVKSPTGELARLENRQSHHVQLMKASLYADTEMEDDISISTGDQLVPISTVVRGELSPATAPLTEEAEPAEENALTVLTDELPMQPLHVQPHTIVLKYHRKVPPFSQTIAGRLGAACLADMSVCRARHSRVGFGPGATLAYVTSRDAVADLPATAELSSLGKYVRGRDADDWSEACVARIAIAQGDSTGYLQEALTRHMETLLEYSEPVSCGEGECPMLVVKQAPGDRRRLLERNLRDADALSQGGAQFGVSGEYCRSVWRLCAALWAADLDNDGVPGTDVASVVNRHKKFLEWMREAVDSITDDELAKPRAGEKEDAEDGCAAQVWTLLLGGRALEACRRARAAGDLALGSLVAQANGDPTFRSLVSRQLSLWRECGADGLIASHRLASLQLVAGEAHSLDKLRDVDWLRALHATARYLCPQVPTLEKVIRTYEGFFTRDQSEESPTDLSTLECDDMSMRLPLPPYADHYEASESGSGRRVLDLRYELIRARALHTRPRLRPAAYTTDPMDYSLCFLVGAWLGGAAGGARGAAAQLEAAGLWHRALQALAYLPDAGARGHLIRGVLSRHAPAKADTPELVSRLELVRRLGIPEEWLLLAQAHRAKYEHLPHLEAEYLAGAGQWNAAHRVLLDQLLPTYVLADDLQSIAPLLEKLNEAAQRHAVSGWECGGQALYHYLHVCDEIRGLVSSAEAPGAAGAAGGAGGVSARLEALRPRVAAACRALRQLKPTTPRHAAARAEMGARLVQLALAGGEPPHHLAALLKTLQLPPDCTAHAYHKITTDLAEQASDSCIESATSSPISSHHRAALHS